MKYIVTIIISCTLFLSCSDDFLETMPRGQETEESFYSNYNNLESAVIGCYSMLSAQGAYDLGYLMLCGDIAGDDMEAGGRDAAEISEIQNIDRMLSTPDNVRIRKIWAYFYKGIYFCNMALKYYPPMLTSGSLTTDEVAVLTVRIGEIQFLRALYYHLLTQVFGGVVYLEEPAGEDDFSVLGRSTIKEIYTLIESDLGDAIDALPDKSTAIASGAGRASKQAAQALLAKVLLYESSYAKYCAGDVRMGACQERWGEALTAAQSVISSNQCQLIGLDGTTYTTFWNDGPTDAYRYMFTVEGDNNAESIFEIQETMDLNAGWIQARGNGLTSWTTFRRFLAPDGTTERDWGWGWMTPSAELRTIFDEGDPRIKTTFGTVGDSALTTDGWRLLAMGYSPTGYCLRKYESSPADYWDVNGGDWNRGPVNEKVLRLADVYLMAAEAAFESNQPAIALEYVNLVRRRADMCDGSDDGIPSQLTAVTLEDIRNERRRELTGEGHRFFDLVRWGIAEEKLNETTLVHHSIELVYQSPKYDFFPIPQTEIDVSNGALVQYEGWR